MLIVTEKCVECGRELNIYQTEAGLTSDGDICLNMPGIVCFDCSFDLVNKVPDPPGLICVRVLTPTIAISILETGEFRRPIEEASLFFIRLFSKNSEVIVRGAIRMHASGLEQTAVMLLEGLLPECDDPVPLLLNLAAMHGMNGDPARGLKTLEQVPSTTGRYHAIKGNLLKGTGDWEGAAASWRDAIRTEPDDEVAWQNLGYYLSQVAKDYAQAEQHCRHSCHIFPDNRRFRAYLGDSLFFQDRLQEALAEYEHAVAIPDNDDVFEQSLRRMLEETRKRMTESGAEGTAHR